MERIYLRIKDDSTTSIQKFDVTQMFEQTIEVAIKSAIEQITKGDKS